MLQFTIILCTNWVTRISRGLNNTSKMNPVLNKATFSQNQNSQEFVKMNMYVVPDMISLNSLCKNEISFVQYFRKETCFVEFIGHQRQYLLWKNQINVCFFYWLAQVCQAQIQMMWLWSFPHPKMKVSADLNTYFLKVLVLSV